LETAHPAFKWTGLQPLILLTEYNPWAMVIGSDTPTFALYIDGTAIYWNGDRRSGKYMTAHLSPSQVTDLFDAAHLDSIEGLKDCYAIDDGTDAPTNVLVVKTQTGYKTIDVYGVIRRMENISPSRLPPDLQAAFHTLLAFDTAEARSWQPPYFEVIIWPFTYAKSSVRWPASFPGINDKNTQPTKHGYRLFLPIAELDQYRTFLAKMKPTQAVLLERSGR